MTDELAKHLAQQEAQRNATGQSSLEGMMAKISADMTAEAASKKDHAAAFRHDLTRFPPPIVLSAAIKHRNALMELPIGTKDREKAIHDMDVFLAEHGAK